MKFELSHRDGASHVRVTGSIYAGVGLAIAELVPRLTEKRVVFDLNGVVGINSIGCAEWARAIKDLVSTRLVELDHCPVAFVDYCNLFPGLLGGPGRGSSVMIKTFRAPYHCKQCKAGSDMALAIADVLTTRLLPARTCPRCGTEMGSEVESEDYLMFLDRIM